MKQKDFFEIYLPKWPALVVVGNPVTQDQAAEIIVRTNGYLSSNDYRFNNSATGILYDLEIEDFGYGGVDKAIMKKLGLEKDQWREIHDYEKKKRSELGMLDLGYLNNSRICSSWIGGPHGWCNWDGTIGCWNYNIGKWPSVQQVFQEWKMIAKEFPFLDLKCQLFNHEASCEEDVDDPRPLIEFHVKGGKVKMVLPKGKLATPSFGGDSFDFLRPGAEIGCTLETLQKAVDLVKSKSK